MAESSDALIQFDSIILDVNENQPHLGNHVPADIGEHDTLKSSLQCDVDSTTNSQLSFNSILVPENSDEVRTNILDGLSQNLDEVSANSQNSDSGIHDADNNIVDNGKLIDFVTNDLNLSDDCGIMMSDFSKEENDVQVRDEEFHDAVQFFKDPSSFTILEKAGSSSTADSLITRSSLYVNFDPLHAKFFSQSSAKPNDLQEIAENEVEHEVKLDNLQTDAVPTVENKLLANVSPRQSFGNILLSFDSPVTGKDQEVQSNENSKQTQKLYTEEEFQKALKIQELSLQDTFLKKQHDLEIARSIKQEELEAKIEKQSQVMKTFASVLQEIFDIAIALSDKEKTLQEQLKIAEAEKDNLREELKSCEKDLQSVENTFSDFHKRYEQCKSTLKDYTVNEETLKQQLENLTVQLNEREEMYKALQSRSQEMVDKANTEVANAKKAGDAQIAVLKAQLKKAELKISSLESDVKHVKIENGKLSSICDELMAKVSES